MCALKDPTVYGTVKSSLAIHGGVSSSAWLLVADGTVMLRAVGLTQDL